MLRFTNLPLECQLVHRAWVRSTCDDDDISTRIDTFSTCFSFSSQWMSLLRPAKAHWQLEEDRCDCEDVQEDVEANCTHDGVSHECKMQSFVHWTDSHALQTFLRRTLKSTWWSFQRQWISLVQMERLTIRCCRRIAFICHRKDIVSLYWDYWDGKLMKFMCFIHTDFFAINLWNAMLTPERERSERTELYGIRWKCPSVQSPYLRTWEN